MLHLPVKPDDLTLRAFGLAVSCAGGLVAALCAAVAGAPLAAAGAGAIAVVAAVAAVARPRWLALAFESWNRAVGWYAWALAWLAKAVCFHVVLRAVAVSGGKLQVREPSPDASSWVRRGFAQGRLDVVQAPATGWVGPYVSWAARSGNLWTVALLPFLSLVAWLEPEPAREVPTNIYTLY